MSSYEIGHVSALLSKNKKIKNKDARSKKLEKIFDQSIQKPFAMFSGKKDIKDQGPGTLIKKSKKKSLKPQNSLVTPETTISEDKNNSSLRKKIKGKQKKGKLETVHGQCSKKQTKLLPFPGIFAVEAPSESSAINVEKVKVKAFNKKKSKMTNMLSHQEKMDMESSVATQNIQDFPLGKCKKKNNGKSCQKSEDDSDCKVPMKFQRNVQQLEVLEDKEGEDMGDEDTSRSVSIIKRKAASKTKSKHMAKMLSNPEEVDSENCVTSQIPQESPLKKGKKKLKLKSCQKSVDDANSDIAEFPRVVRKRKFSEDSLDDEDILHLDDLQPSKDEDSGEEIPKGDYDFVPVPKAKLHGFEGHRDNEERLRRTLFVGNLPTTADPELLRILFNPFGNIESVGIRPTIPPKQTMTKKVANIRKKYHQNCYSLNGFVVFSTKECAEKALSLNATVFQNHHIRVVLASNENNHNDECSIFVGNLPFKIDDEKLWSTFAECGAIKSVHVVRNKETGISKGIGFVLFEDKEAVSEALNLNETQVCGQNIRVQKVDKSENTKVPNTAKRTRIHEKANATIVQNHPVRVHLASKQNTHNDECSVFVGNLPFEIDDEKLWSTFAECGTIKSVHVVRNKETGIGKGFGFVLFEDKEAVSEALNLNETQFCGRNICVRKVVRSKNAKRN